MNPIGIMQGRLSAPINERIQSFPATTWRTEFERARRAGLDRIEWIFDEEDTDGKPNPIMTDAGLTEMRQLILGTGVNVLSVCADYFMRDPLLDASGRRRPSSVERLISLLRRAQTASLQYVILPFVDASSAAALPSLNGMREMLLGVLSATADSNVEVHLEMDLGPAEVSTFLRSIGHPRLRANLDIGNSASLGHDPDHEMLEIGPILGSVHVKDRVRGSGTVPLGTGDADFETYFRHFASLRFGGPFILQVARSNDMDEAEWARRNRMFVETAVRRASMTAAEH